MLERMGVQTAAVLTHTFSRPGDAMARVQGFPDYRYAVMTHPISSLSEQQIRERAQSALPDVLAVLGIEQ
jgi:hypothetical protein